MVTEKSERIAQMSKIVARISNLKKKKKIIQENGQLSVGDMDVGCFNSLNSSSQVAWREVLTYFNWVFIHG